MFRQFLSSVKILRSINFVELPVEFFFVANMLILTVLSISYLDVLSISVLDYWFDPVGVGIINA